MPCPVFFLCLSPSKIIGKTSVKHHSSKSFLDCAPLVGISHLGSSDGTTVWQDNGVQLWISHSKWVKAAVVATWLLRDSGREEKWGHHLLLLTAVDVQRRFMLYVSGPHHSVPKVVIDQVSMPYRCSFWLRWLLNIIIYNDHSLYVQQCYNSTISVIFAASLSFLIRAREKCFITVHSFSVADCQRLQIDKAETNLI